MNKLLPSVFASLVLVFLSLSASADDAKLRPYLDLKLGSVIGPVPLDSGNIPFDAEIGLSLSNDWGEVRFGGAHHSNADEEGLTDTGGEEYNFNEIFVAGRVYLGCIRGC